MTVGDKVSSPRSLWSGDIGTIVGIVGDYDYIHVIFPENDKHYAYQQTFYSKNNLIIQKHKQ